MSFCLHTHSVFCDGKSTMEELCESAIEKGLKVIGFSSHAPVPVPSAWAMKFEEILSYRAEIDRCKALFSGKLEILSALEADYFPQLSISFSEWKRMLKLDYIIGAVHLVKGENNEFWFLDGPEENYEKGIQNAFQGDAKKAVCAYFAQLRDMIRTQQPDIIAHLDKVVMNNKGRYFSESESWYKQEVMKTLSLIKEQKVVVEINTRGIYREKWHDYFPSKSIIKQCVDMDIKLTISPDAHQASELDAGFNDALKDVERLGGKHLALFSGHVWKQISIEDVTL